jgi:hypothetical protein
MNIDREDIKSVKFTVDQGVEKSIQSELTYESSIKIDKTGKEIKEKLKLIILDNIVKKNKIFNVLDNLVQITGELPNCTLDEYELKGFRKKLTVIPYKYNDQSDVNKHKYNNILREYIDLSVDCIVIKTIIDNIIENKDYQMNAALAAKLGF